MLTNPPKASRQHHANNGHHQPFLCPLDAPSPPTPTVIPTSEHVPPRDALWKDSPSRVLSKEATESGLSIDESASTGTPTGSKQDLVLHNSQSAKKKHISFNTFVEQRIAIDPVSSSVQLQQHFYCLFLKGASEILTKKCTCHVVISKNQDHSQRADFEIETKAIEEFTKDNISRTIIFYANLMLRTIALCYRDFEGWPPPGTHSRFVDEVLDEDLSRDLTLVAITGIEDPLCPGVREAVATCHHVGVTIKMCTGDNILIARPIATQCGIYTAGGIIMECPVFRALDPQERIEDVPRLQVLARSSPEDRKILVETLRSLGEIVGVTSDGTNNSPTLKTANVGFSMGIAGTEVAKEASDIILMDDNFASIVKVSCGVAVSMTPFANSSSSRSRPTSPRLSSRLYLLSPLTTKSPSCPPFNLSGLTLSWTLLPPSLSPRTPPWYLYWTGNRLRTQIPGFTSPTTGHPLLLGPNLYPLYIRTMFCSTLANVYIFIFSSIRSSA